MNTYTLGEESYVVVDDCLYTVEGTEHSRTEIESGTPYLYDGEVVTFQDEGDIFTSITVFPVGEPDESFVVQKDSFGTAVLLSRVVVPEGVYECPSCGGLAGSKETYDGPNCWECKEVGEV